MQRQTVLRWLAAAFLVAVLSGAAAGGGAGPEPLKAQSACGMFSGNLCSSKCNRECTNGSCCDWSYYYYLIPVDDP